MRTPESHDHVCLIHGFSQEEPPRLIAGYLAIGLRRDGECLYIDTMRRELLEYVGWHPQTTVPSRESLRRLEMEFLLEDVAAFQVPPA